MPKTIMNLLDPFAPIFDRRTWVKVRELVAGAILSPGKRTVTSALRAIGKAQQMNYAKYHHVLNRAKWSSREVSLTLLDLLLAAFSGSGSVVMGIDEHIERRRGKKIAAKGIYRDGVRSSKSHFVKASGLRWVSLMLLCSVPWARRVWALPFLTALAPSERYYEPSARQPKKLTDWARQMIFQLRRWLPSREIVVVGDNTYAVLGLLHACQSLPNPVTMIARLRMDAALYEPAPPYSGVGRPRKKGERLPALRQCLADPDTVWQACTLKWYNAEQRQMELASSTAVWYHKGKPPIPIRWVLIRDPQGKYDPLALLCTDPTRDPLQIVQWFVLRWQVEVTFEEVRAHLGVETQRQWSHKAIARTTPALLGLFSWVTLAAHVLQAEHPLPARQTAWYTKRLPTFSDAIAFVRSHLWHHQHTFRMSPAEPEVVKMPRSLFNCLVDTLCYAA